MEGLGLDTLTVRTDRGDTVELKPSDYEHFSHGYAATVHKAQGATVDRTLVYGSALMDRHLAYVALTRHRDDAVLYAAKEAFDSFADLAQRFSRDGSASTTLDHAFMRQRVTIADGRANRDRGPDRRSCGRRPRRNNRPKCARRRPRLLPRRGLARIRLPRRIAELAPSQDQGRRATTRTRRRATSGPTASPGSAGPPRPPPASSDPSRPGAERIKPAGPPRPRIAPCSKRG